VALTLALTKPVAQMTKYATIYEKNLHIVQELIEKKFKSVRK
jgi:hypothetical protein